MFQIETDILSYILKNEIKIINLLAVLMFICGFIVYVILLYQPATYGRYSTTGKFYSIAVPVKVAWFLQEVPAFLVSTFFVTYSLFGDADVRYTPLQLGVLSFYIGHYFLRSVKNMFNSLTRNCPKWSDTIWRSYSKCCKIFKVCLTVLGSYALRFKYIDAIFVIFFKEKQFLLLRRFPEYHCGEVLFGTKFDKYFGNSIELTSVNFKCNLEATLNLYYAIDLIYTFWKHKKTRGLFYVFRRYKKIPMAWNGLIHNHSVEAATGGFANVKEKHLFWNLF